MARKRLFINAIADKIKQDLINGNTDLDFIKTVAKGDLYLMPSPETLGHKDTARQYLPALFIKPSDFFNTSVNQNKSISSGTYSFTLRYVHYYDTDDTTTVYDDAINGVELITDTLLGDDNMNDESKLGVWPSYIPLKDKDGEEIGDILGTDIFRVSFDEVDTEIFKQLDIPVLIFDIEYSVVFRSRYVGR